MTSLNSIVRTETPRPALRLVNTRKLARTDWLAVRKTGIGGSDAAAAVGLSPYKSPLELWLEKTGRDEHLLRPDPADTSHPVYWGTVLEPIVAGAYALHTGRKLRRVHAVLQHPQYPFMLANLDREIVGSSDVQILECKTAGEFGARHWRDGVPEYVQLQVQHQLAVTGKPVADVAVLVCGQTLEIHRIPRDEELIARLIVLETRFWDSVVNDIPPPADGSESADRALRCLYPGNGSVVDWSDDSRMSSLFSDLVSIRARIKEQEAEAERLRQTLAQAMGDVGEALFETGRISFKRSRDSIGLDIERLRADHPALVNRYAINKPGSRRFRICD
jgi:putative phage-type endonuclease